MSKKKLMKQETAQETKEKCDLVGLCAELALNPSYAAAAAMEIYAKIFGELDSKRLAIHLADKTKELASGDLSRAEAMLFNQAHALQAIFTNLSRRAIGAEYMNNLDRYLRLALKAQAQCTRTIEVLGNLKNPSPIAFVKQANIGQAVQVNNDSSAPRAQENLNPSNELLEKKDEQRLDSRTTPTTIPDDSNLEPVE